MVGNLLSYLFKARTRGQTVHRGWRNMNKTVHVEVLTGDAHPSMAWLSPQWKSLYKTLHQPYVDGFARAADYGAAGVVYKGDQGWDGTVILWDGEAYTCIGTGTLSDVVVRIEQRVPYEAAGLLLEEYGMANQTIFTELASHIGAEAILRDKLVVGGPDVALAGGLYW